MIARPFRWPIGPAVDGTRVIPELKPLPPLPEPLGQPKPASAG
jgi:hypothetical protein